MAAQIHIAGSTWIRVSRQLVNRSFTPAKSITKAPTISASGASQRRERLSRRMASSAAATSLSLTAWTNRSICARRADRRDRGFSPRSPLWDGPSPDTVRSDTSIITRSGASPRADEAAAGLRRHRRWHGGEESIMPAQAAETPARAVGRYQLDTAGCRLTSAERAARGKAARARVPRDTHAVFDPPPDRLDPIALLEQQAASRVPELVPVRWGRMMVSPFSYYRGAALPMASDLATTPVSGLAVQACGDAHLSNFGLFGSAERQLVFDVNDFDETLPGPWEWDVKRLAASMFIAAKENGFVRPERERIVVATVGRYRQAMRGFAGMTN